VEIDFGKVEIEVNDAQPFPTSAPAHDPLNAGILNDFLSAFVLQ
jgi:hypothetical protein